MSKGFVYNADVRDASLVNSWMDRVDRRVEQLVDEQPPAAADYDAVITSLQERLDDLEYTAVDITSFTGGSSNERGATVTTVNAAWAINKTVTGQTLTDTTITPAARSKAFTGLTLTTNKTYTLVATDGTSSDTAAISVAFYDKRHWGVSAATSLASADILTLAGGELATSRLQSRTFDCSGGRYIYLCWPASWSGTPTFTVGGLVTTFTKDTLSHTNASGAVVTYDVFRSLNLQNGAAISVVVT